MISRMSKGSIGCLLMAVIWGLWGCQTELVPRDGAPERRPVSTISSSEPENYRPAGKGAVEHGQAAYYANSLHGKPTASGEPYDRDEMTAAHPSLPFNTICRVTNLRNGRSVEVRINDRCSRAMGRILDLSYAAAEAIGSLHAGVVEVRLEVIGIRSY